MRRVVITGMGIVSPVGTGIEYAWHNIVNGKSGIRKITALLYFNFCFGFAEDGIGGPVVPYMEI